MSRILGSAVLSLIALTLVAQARPPQQSHAPNSTGVLIGWSPQGDSADPDAEKALEEAKQDRELTVPSEVTLPDGSKVSHLNQTAAADPLLTAWIFVSEGKVTARLMQHIIVPRKDGFWQLGSNTDTAQLEGANYDEDLFWLAPLGQQPKLSTIKSDEVNCSTSTARRDLTYVGPEYFGYSEFGSAECAHYGEGHYYQMWPLRTAPSINSPTDAPVDLGTLLGSAAVAQHRRINREARRWPNGDCGENGFEGETTQWTLRHRQGRWEAVAKFHGSGAGICDRYHQDAVLDVSLPRSLVAVQAPLPVTWKILKGAFPDAVDAVTSPDAKLVIVFTASQAIVASVEAAALRPLSPPIKIAPGKPVMLEWAVGANAVRWNQVLSTLPPPNPKATTRPAAP